ncbi:MAG: sugar phosphate isomerase/epimerase [Planctomycetes bacterium]|jgi:inosose dehydratase|nr:sugar phosphate isomerase/epimerase [Planctomycetota bacterium]
MNDRVSSRRELLKETVLATGLAAVLPSVGSGAGPSALHVACNQYPWGTFYARQKKDFNKLLDAGLAEVKASGNDGFEPGVGGLQQIEQMTPLLKKHGLEMWSLYVNSTLHEAGQAEKSIEDVVAAAGKAQAFGTRIIVTNPSPLRWGGAENKTDEHLQVQAAALDKLGARLKQMGLVLAYHNHDMELRCAAREFHHMMAGTDPAHVTLCLDAHWIYRGSGNSQVALFDVVKLYGPRITELHLRQSQNGVWTEAFGPGDIDYPRLAAGLLQIGVKPLLVLEQAVEAGSPNTMNAVGAFQKSTAYARQVFADFAA